MLCFLIKILQLCVVFSNRTVPSISFQAHPVVIRTMAIWQDFTLEFHFLELNNSPHSFRLSCINFLSQIHANLCIWWLVSFQNYKSDSQLWQQTMKSDMEINLDPQNIDTLHVWGRFQVYVPHALMLHELNQWHHTFATLELKQNLAY